MSPSFKKSLRGWCLVLSVILLVVALVFARRFGRVESEARAAVARGADAATVTISDDAWQMPVDVANSGDPSRGDWINLGWNTFIAICWPAQPDGEPGQPNEGVNITEGDDGPAVWSTYLAKEQLFRPSAGDPGSWTNPTAEPVTEDGVPVLDGWSKTEPDTIGEFDEAFSDAPLIDVHGNYVLYEIRLNQSEFTYVDVNQYYNAEKQKAAFKTDPISFVGFPKTGNDIVDPATNQPVVLPGWAQQGALEIKASWRILTADDDASRYYTQESYVMTPDGETTGPHTLGLVGLHILRLTPTTGSTWFWATFEQVDNVGESGHVPASFYSSELPAPGAGGYSYQPPKVQSGEPLPEDPTPVNVKRVYPIPSDVAAANSSYQAALDNSVWKYYQLIDVQNPVPAGTPGAGTVPHNPDAFSNTDKLANVTMETYQQVIPGTTSPQNCVNCHGEFGFPQGAPQTPTYQVFSFLLDDATSPEDN